MYRFLYDPFIVSDTSLDNARCIDYVQGVFKSTESKYQVKHGSVAECD